MSSEHMRRIERLERTPGDDPEHGRGRILLPQRLSPRDWILAVQNWECQSNGISRICERCGRLVGVQDNGSPSFCRVCDYVDRYEKPEE